MDKLTPKQIKALEKIAKIKEDKDTATVESFMDIEDKLENLSERVEKISKTTEDKIDAIQEELKKKLESELVLEIDREELKGKDGSDGKDYVLTEKDKKEIASAIKVPIVEKIIEKTEVIKEIPIITNEIKEVAIPESPDDTRNKLESLVGNRKMTFGAIRESEDVLKDIKELKQRPPQIINNIPTGNSGIEKVKVNGVEVRQGVSELSFTGSGVSSSRTSNGVNITIVSDGDTDEKVKYDAGDPTAGYVADKFVAGTGITIAEGTGADENKVKITNTFAESQNLQAVTDIGSTTTNVITGKAQPTFTYSGGVLQSIGYTNGTSKSFTYNVDGTLSTLTVIYPDTTTINKTFNYTAGQLISITVV